MELADPERALALAYAPAARREALSVLWALDERLGGVFAAAREPMLRAIRLAWWREALTALDGGGRVPDEPMLRAVAALLLPAGLSGRALAELEEGWAAVADPSADAEALALHGSARGGRLFALSARALGVEPDAAIASAGAGWALADMLPALEPEAAKAARAMARAAFAAGPRRWPRGLRALGVSAALAARYVARPMRARRGAPARVLRALAMGATGF